MSPTHVEPLAPTGLVDPANYPNKPDFGSIVEEHEVPAGGHLCANGLEVTHADGRVEHPTAEQTRLEDVLPEIHALAQKVGGLDQLAEIIQNMTRTTH